MVQDTEKPGNKFGMNFEEYEDMRFDDRRNVRL